jgi:serine O-acetyltransferase
MRSEMGAEPSSWRLWIGALSPRFAPVLLCRLAHKSYLVGIAPLAHLISFVNLLCFGIEIAVRCPIGPGLLLPHPQGTVIGAWRIGENATIFQGVTLGAREIDFAYDERCRPTLGDDVTVGAGAKVLGEVHVGNGATIGANAVLLESVPARALAVGVPARVMRRDVREPL